MTDHEHNNGAGDGRDAGGRRGEHRGGGAGGEHGAQRDDEREDERDADARGQGRGAATRFLARLRNKAFRDRLVPKLRKIKEGDWPAMVELARAEGFVFDVDQLKAATPDTFFKGAGRNPRRFWSRATLER